MGALTFCWYISKNILNTLQDLAYQNYSYHAYLLISFHKEVFFCVTYLAWK